MEVMTNTSNTIETTKSVESSARAAHRDRRVLRVFGRVVGIGLAVVIGLALAGAGYEAIAAGGDARAYPPPGRLVDVGGYRLHIHCIGTGSASSPTVVLDAGLSGTSLDWNLVQGEMAKTTRVCAYDRAGMGWSDPQPQDEPRTPGRIASELHTLLTNAGIPGPYVLVGHSLAGKNVRMFALQHPDEVAGMVLVDTRSEYVDEHESPADEQTFAQSLAREGNLYGLTRALGLMRLFGASQFGTPAMTDQTRLEMALFASGQRGRDATIAEGLQRAADDAQLKAAPSLGERPLIVLAAGQSMEKLSYWPEAQRHLATLSTNGHLIVVQGSGHYIHFFQPAVVIDAVGQVVAQVRGR